MKTYAINVSETTTIYIDGCTGSDVIFNDGTTGRILKDSVNRLEPLNEDYVAKHFKHMLADERLAGKNEAWNAVRKLHSCEDIADWTEMGFGIAGGDWTECFEYILNKYSPTEVIEKIKAYEEKKAKAEAEIHIGDEVECGGSTVIVTHINLKGRTFDGVGVNSSGGLGTYTGRPLKEWRKNGISHKTYADEHQNG